MAKFLVAGLGNPGKKYELTRHNIGFLVADELAAVYKVNYQMGKHAVTGSFRLQEHQVVLIKPITFMNLSGLAVQHWLHYFKIPKENLLAITDDIALPFGKLRMKPSGSAGGHNGLKDIQTHLGTQEYARLRMGVGNQFPKGRQSDYVLSPFSKEEQAYLPETIEKAANAALSFCNQGIETAMNKYNG